MAKRGCMFDLAPVYKVKKKLDLGSLREYKNMICYYHLISIFFYILIKQGILSDWEKKPSKCWHSAFSYGNPRSYSLFDFNNSFNRGMQYMDSIVKYRCFHGNLIFLTYDVLCLFSIPTVLNYKYMNYVPKQNQLYVFTGHICTLSKTSL